LRTHTHHDHQQEAHSDWIQSRKEQTIHPWLTVSAEIMFRVFGQTRPGQARPYSVRFGKDQWKVSAISTCPTCHGRTVTSKRVCSTRHHWQHLHMRSTFLMDTLPRELVDMVLGQADSLTLPLLALVCRTWRALIEKQHPGPRGRVVVEQTFKPGPKHGCFSSRVCAVHFVRRLIRARRWTAAEWVRAHVPSLDESDTLFRATHVSVAARTGDLVRLRSLCEHSNGAVTAKTATWLYGKATRRAARGGHMHVLQWLHSNGNLDPKVVCYGAAKGGHLHVLEWSQTAGCPLRGKACTFAAKHGHLDALRWLVSHGCLWKKGACDAAASSGRLDIMQWARQNGCMWDRRAYVTAAFRGDLSMLQWLRASGCPWHRLTCYMAAAGGHVHVLQWAIAGGCLRSDALCTGAAKGGHLHVLQWAYAQGCPLVVEAYYGAIANGHVHIIEWLWANECPQDADMLLEAAIGGQIQVALWALDHGYKWRDNLCTVMCRHNRLAMLKWAVAQGRPWDKEAYLCGVSNYDTTFVAEWIRRQ